jgi:glycosyltransferase involved in cell wall biosynthesis
MNTTKKIIIGIHIDSRPELLKASICAIHEHTNFSFELALLIDSEEPALNKELSSIARIHKMFVGNGLGRASCFNHLIGSANADIYVFMENGVMPGPACLDKLVDALAADAYHGLAGPSTNRGWNEQALGENFNIAHTAVGTQARKESQRISDIWRTLEPLYSLADFCYAVKKELISEIGAADEIFGAGPCWEMDYNIRAARAGFKGIWVRDAFALRSPISEIRIATERQLIDASKRHYQDNFCARRHDLGAAYNKHCSGDACRNFAQTAKITMHVPLQKRYTSHMPTDIVLPLVSCIMPTRGRPQFVAQSIRYFLRQDYAPTELVIAYETDEDLPERTDETNIKYVRTVPGSSIGAKRNAAVRISTGNIIAQWDDDDWYDCRRLAAQVEPILQNVADITGLKDILFLAIDDDEYWGVSANLFRRLFAEDVCGGTLTFRRSVWDFSGPYAASSMREDAEFLIAAMRDGARLCRVAGHRLFVYVRHGANTWRFEEGHYLNPIEWRRVEMPDFLEFDHSFYQMYSAKSKQALGNHENPLVSCIMPTFNRRNFISRAIANFQRQSYRNKELVIVDDGFDSIADLIPHDPLIRYHRLNSRCSIGAKRNFACRHSSGKIIVHWDDDDWMSPDWLDSQVTTLTRKNADVCGLDKVFFHAPELRRAWKYVYDGKRPWVCGGTLCYTKAFWERNHFPDINIGEDNAFVWSTLEKNLAINNNSELYVATIHGGNTSPKHTDDRRWQVYPVREIEKLLSTPR